MRSAPGLGSWIRLPLAPLGLALAAAIWLVAGAAAPASALTIDPNPVSFFQITDEDTDAFVSGTITWIETATGIPSGGTQLAGTTGVSDLSLVFEVTLDAGSDSIDSVGVGVFLVNSTGAGTIAGTGDVAVGSVSGTAGTRIFNFTGNLDAEETSDRFFISYASLSEGQSVTFMISPADGSADFTVTSTLVAVPEASALMLLGIAGLATAPAWLRRRRRGA
jgi:hypothetical protein